MIDIDFEKIRNDVEREGYSIVENVISKSLYDEARAEYYLIMESEPLHGQAIQFDPARLDSGPWRKTAVGLTNGIGDPYPQLLQTTYLAKPNSSPSALSQVAGLVKRVRNAVTDMSPEFPCDSEPKQFWDAARVHHYPSGGGFMGLHRDTHFPSVLGDCSLPFLQVYISISQREVDFDTGGGYVISKSGQKIYTENDGFGQLVCFDGSIPHGVDPVDLHRTIDFSAVCGRIAIFNGLYQRL